MRRRISEQFLEHRALSRDANRSQGLRLSIIDLVGNTPADIVQGLSLHDHDRVEVLGFYDNDGGYPFVKSLNRPQDFRSQVVT